MDFETDIRPASVPQALFLLLLWKEVPAGVPRARIYKDFATAVNKKFSCHWTPELVQSLFTTFNTRYPDLLGLRSVNFHSLLADVKLGSVAVAPVTECLCCGGKKLNFVVNNHPTTFFHNVNKPELGTTIHKYCNVCRVRYYVNGYVKEASQPVPGGSKPPKTPYPPNLDHKEWEESSRYTVIHKALFRRYDANLMVQHGSFNGFAKVENFVQSSGRYR